MKTGAAAQIVKVHLALLRPQLCASPAVLCIYQQNKHMRSAYLLAGHVQSPVATALSNSVSAIGSRSDSREAPKKHIQNVI
jgi:formaldehyde-activating enzyme involved in methanogenesis